ncbi:hypothetical protein EJ08DRAFT_691853 [Tothia fuscella]|uniref:Retrovirus-related Pol polyprotein from transposon TNT 1-94-like beta-barrel domain-containing protein n=1 Tax=Tothia fuscella TaxID=1048955 RepID=A0A9P4P4Z5_9PEZI|nr:hypothetical protein EJ08DRAFT_691853 [Tothia fuscella]
MPVVARYMAETTGWKPDRKVANQIKAERKTCKAAINTAINYAKPKAANWVNNLKSGKSDLPTSESPEPKIIGNIQAVCLYAAASVSSVPRDVVLKDLKIGDSGADWHVWNNSREVNITRQAEDDEFLLAGDRAIKIEAWGNVRMPVRLPRSTELGLMILNDVILVPTFFTSVVSTRKLKKSGFEINTWTNQVIRHDIINGQDVGKPVCDI